MKIQRLHQSKSSLDKNKPPKLTLMLQNQILEAPITTDSEKQLLSASPFPP